jgi:hypothetical protein
LFALLPCVLYPDADRVDRYRYLLVHPSVSAGQDHRPRRFGDRAKCVNSGESFTGHFEFTPKVNTNINGIHWTIRCTEKCVSGSGSNRTTHTHEVLRKEITLMEAGQLVSGKPHHYELSFAVPQTAPPSLKFTDNELTWGSQLRIDIPRWPDWVKEVPFVVKVSSE